MSREAAKSDNDAGMLQPAARVNQAGADDASCRVAKTRDHFAEPVRLDNFDVVVEQQDQFAAGEPNPTVDLARKIEWRSFDLILERGFVLFGLAVEVEHLLIRRPVVNHDNFN